MYPKAGIVLKETMEPVYHSNFSRGSVILACPHESTKLNATVRGTREISVKIFEGKLTGVHGMYRSAGSMKSELPA